MYLVALVAPQLILYGMVLCEPSVIYKMKNIECFGVAPFSANSSCYIKPINWNKAVAQMDVELLQPLHNISVRVQLFKRDYSNQYQPFLVDVTINICDILSRRSFMPVGVIIIKVTKRFSNFNHSCPFAGHLMARGAYIDESFVPNYFPLGLYKINITIMENYPKKQPDHAGSIVWYVQAMIPVINKKNKN
ncbi:uncharacterized protein LOC111077250 [Drosophila obscura]|uniref:uncharacterized protein LOC111077250 n=1 Tax=Drosophila obscura TaxID=7282 RepID=UPI001BB12498|nr:uncharacterized protein LOC111077250 [Drosophila obscura]